jgi:hypothetical protein
MDEISDLSKTLEILNNRNINILDYFINLTDNNYKNEYITNNLLKNINIDDVEFNISNILKQFFYLFQNDYIIFSLNDYNKIFVITLDIETFNNKNLTNIINNNHKIVFVDSFEINIYYYNVLTYTVYEKIVENFNNLFPQNNDDIVIYYYHELFMYPLFFYKIFKQNNNINNLNIKPNINFNNQITKSLNPKNYKNMTEIDKEQFFYLLINLNKTELLEKFLNYLNKYDINRLCQKYIFNIIDILNINSLISILKEYKDVDFDILNNNGLNPLEYSLLQYKQYQNQKLYEIINILKTYNYTRKAYYIDHILHLNTLKYNFDNKCEEKILNKIKDMNNFDNINIINAIILNIYYEDMNNKNNNITIDNIIKFIEKNYKFINKNILFNIFYKYSSIIIIKELLIKNVIIVDYDLIKLFVKMKKLNFLYDNYKEKTLQYSNLLIYDILYNNDIYGLIFLIRYVNKNLIYLKDKKGNNLLHYYLNKNNIENDEDLNFKILQVLLNNNENIIYDTNNNGEIPLFNTIKNNNYVMFKLLLDYDSSMVNIPNNDKNYIIHEIIKKKNIEFLKYYIFKNCNCELLDNYNNTPLLLSLKTKNQEFANILINNNVKLNCIDKNNNTIYHIIALYDLNKVKIDHIENLLNSDNKNVSDCLKSKLFENYNMINNQNF